MLEILINSTQKKWMGLFLRVLAIFYFLGASVHYGNIFGLGEIPWSESPLLWRVLDVFYGILDTAAVIGLWLKTSWGIGLFIVAATSQLILYLGFPQWFAFSPEQQQSLWSLIIFHVLCLAIFLSLLFGDQSN